jgi:hypothetical protein
MRVGRLLDPALQGLGVRGQVREEQVRTVFASIVGPALSDLCRAVRLDRNVLVIATANTALSHQLHLDSQHVIASLNAKLGTDVVRRLRFVPM